MSGGDPTPPPTPMKVEAPPVPMTDVLVAATDMPMGQVLRPTDLRWQPWPDNAVNAGFVTRKSQSQGPGGLRPAPRPAPGFLAGEPIRAQKLVRPESGFMAAILPPGQRAVAITTDSRGTNSAGGFILPNDRVDVIRTFHKITKTNEREPRCPDLADDPDRHPRPGDRPADPREERHQRRHRRDRDAGRHPSPGRES